MALLFYFCLWLTFYALKLFQLTIHPPQVFWERKGHPAAMTTSYSDIKRIFLFFILSATCLPPQHLQFQFIRLITAWLSKHCCVIFPSCGHQLAVLLGSFRITSLTLFGHFIFSLFLVNSQYLHMLWVVFITLNRTLQCLTKLLYVNTWLIWSQRGFDSHMTHTERENSHFIKRGLLSFRSNWQ